MKTTSRIFLAVFLLLTIISIPLPISGIAHPAPHWAAGKLVIKFFDIGQGDAELIQLPDGKTILIDSGDRGAPIVDLLKDNDVESIDLAIASHPHSDHMGEMVKVMREFKVEEFWDAGYPHSTPTYTKMLEEIKKKKIKFKTPRRGESVKFGDVTLEILNPGATFVNDNPNNASLVIKLTFGTKSFLFTGDAQTEAWQQMIATQGKKLRADLLKVAHHGSHNGTTAAILGAVRPKIATISCAAGNSYGHPHKPVMALLKSATPKIRVFRTDLQGTITVTTDGSTIQMSAEKDVAASRLFLTGNQVERLDRIHVRNLVNDTKNN